MRNRAFVLSAAVLLAAAGCASAARTPSCGVCDEGFAVARDTTPPALRASDPAVQRDYDRFARRYLDWYYAANPVRSTGLGIHAFDARLPDVSAAAMTRKAEQLRAWLRELEGIDRRRLGGDRYFDHRLLEYAIRAQLLDVEEVRGWQRNPSWYSDQISASLAGLSSREFAPVAERMGSLSSRLEAVPGVLAAARGNLRDVPKLFAENGVRDMRGTASFLRGDLLAALRAQGMEGVDAARRRRFDAALARATAAVDSFALWLERDVVPTASGDFRLGKDVFERKLRYEEHVELSAERLREINEDAIRRYQAWVAREAARIDPARPVTAVMDDITRNHPTPETLIPTARAQLDTIKRFIVERRIVTLPSDRMPTVRETPPYARLGFASMDTPGPFEKVATEAFYNITNVDPAWTAEQKEQHLTYFNYPGLLGITVHEAMPGHFVQLLYESQIPTEVRKVFNSASVVEGWAHYTEQMMVDEGLGGGRPEVRLGQLRRALQRHARWNAGVSMHAFGTSVEDAARRFEQIAFFAPFPALRETQRGAGDPTYLYYALGRMQILKLRQDYQRYLEARGQTFSLRDFHDRFLRIGLPVSLARQVMMPGDTGESL